MQRDRKILFRRLVRTAALSLVVMAAGAGAWPACGTVESATTPVAGVDPGPTFGAEITIAIKGRGRVVSDPEALDCPSKCFARIVLPDPKVDGSELGLSLTPEATVGSHFAGWTYETVAVGVRARGPSQCSPMTRSTSALAVPTGATRIAVHYGETAGTPPAGLEVTCAEFTRVPLAYALTATFEENSVRPGRPKPAGPVIEVLFEPPALGTIVSKEIGIAGGRLYWRFDRGAASGIASGRVDGQGGGSIVNLPPSDRITNFDVDRHVVFQHASGLVETIQGASGVRTSLNYFSPGCSALASDDTTAYCRYNGGGSTTGLYSWPIGGGDYTYVYALPRGADLAVDGERFYFSDVAIGTQGEAVMESAPRSPDGGSRIPEISKLVFNQTSPHDLVVGPDHLFWLDDEGGNFVSAVTASKLGGGTGLQRGAPGGRFLAVDPAEPDTFYVALASSTKAGDSYIVKASAKSTAVRSFRAGLTGIGGLTVDATHVFWTQNDGRVYRAPKD